MDNVMLDSIKAEEGIRDFVVPSPLAQNPSLNQNSNSNQQSQSQSTPQEGISVLFEEQISLSLNKDGGLDSNLEVKGSLMLRIHDSEKTRISLGMQLYSHPNVQYMVRFSIL